MAQQPPGAQNEAQQQQRQQQQPQQQYGQSSSSSRSRDLSAAPPSSAEVEQAMSHLAQLASLLDPRGRASSSSSASSSSLAPQTGFPGLVEVLPHLLSPLMDISRSSGSGTQPPPAAMPSYGPLVMQVRSIVAQLVATVGAAASSSSIDGSQESSLKVAEWAHAIHRRQRGGKRERQGQGDENKGNDNDKSAAAPAAMSKEEKRESILRARKRRRQMEAGQQSQQGTAEGAAELGADAPTDVHGQAHEASHAQAQSQGKEQGSTLDTIMTGGGETANLQIAPPMGSADADQGRATNGQGETTASSV